MARLSRGLWEFGHCGVTLPPASLSAHFDGDRKMANESVQPFAVPSVKGMDLASSSRLERSGDILPWSIILGSQRSAL